ncbi:hypothetical protein [Mycolicibacterium tusciae]|uniref:hypothetical protein n=1 Tax=Mycolicibacterium tusciae TaxID=75922 RepID=UPI00024A26F2|nr:hypothetical protein [Mycolicibacterium tusciae]
MINSTKNARLEPNEVIVLIPPEDYIKVEILRIPLCEENWIVRTDGVVWAVAGSIDAAVEVAQEHDNTKDGVSIRVVTD